ncbi:NUDIX domain-containing protein [Kitasatospora purpeofusca]|uniref:NUDIX domain-containing protein n=1 Tax=Kitasatospora purpeofusca TaxID=67352 RepID=UPI0035D6829D
MNPYTPTDVTSPELLPQALETKVPDWAEAAPTPDAVTDWPARQAAAMVWFELDDSGLPLNPAGRTGTTGRRLGQWGENPAADAIAVAGTGPARQVLLITRDDIGVAATPGGMIEDADRTAEDDPDKTVENALLRELREETGVDLRGHQVVILGRQVVDDWRNTDQAWVASAYGLIQLTATVPAVGADDARDALWWPFASLDQLEAALAADGRTLYAAHRPLLQAALDHLAQ